MDGQGAVVVEATLLRSVIGLQVSAGRPQINYAHAVLRSALSEAKRLQLVTINAAELVTVPKPARRPIRPLSVEDAARFLKAATRPVS